MKLMSDRPYSDPTTAARKLIELAKSIEEDCDLLLPMRATSSCHRCRSRAGWRIRNLCQRSP